MPRIFDNDPKRYQFAMSDNLLTGEYPLRLVNVAAAIIN